MSRRRVLIPILALSPALLTFVLLWIIPAKRTGSARLLVEQWANWKTETLEWRGIIFQVENGESRSVEVLAAFPPIPKDDMHVFVRNGQPIAFARLLYSDEKTGGELTPESVGINVETNVCMNREIYGLADGTLRLWPEHVRYLEETGQIPKPRRSRG